MNGQQTRAEANFMSWEQARARQWAVDPFEAVASYDAIQAAGGIYAVMHRRGGSNQRGRMASIAQEAIRRADSPLCLAEIEVAEC